MTQTPGTKTKLYFILQCHLDLIDSAFYVTDHLYKSGHDYLLSVTANKHQFDLKSVTLDEFKNFK